MFQELIKNRITQLWMTLVILSISIWTIATGMVPSTLPESNLSWATFAIIAIAVFKSRLIALYFMDIRNQNAVIRFFLESWCLIVLIGLTMVAYAPNLPDIIYY